MISLKNPIPAGWKAVPKEVPFKGKRTPVEAGKNGMFYKVVDEEVVLVNVGTVEVLVSSTKGISQDDALRYAVEICTMEVGDAVTLL